MKKLPNYLPLIFAAVMICFGMSACSSPLEKLSAPSGFALSGKTVMWEAVENAVGYAVAFKNNETETIEPRFTLPDGLEAGYYTVEVLAIGDYESCEDSDWTAFSFTLEKQPEQGYDSDGFFFTLLSDGSGYEVGRGNANLTGTVAIPAYFNGLPVKKIADGFFYFGAGDPSTGSLCNVLTTEIKLPDTVTEIGRFAFACIIKLEEITIPDTVTEIGFMAFWGCMMLKHVTLPSRLKVIPPGCFQDCALSEISFPDGLEEIGEMAFRATYYPSGHIKRSDQSFTKIDVPDSVKKIGNSAFSGCLKLKEINLPDELERMGRNVFYETAWLEALPDGLVTLEGVLCGYKGDIEEGAKISIPHGIKYIASGAFSNEKNLAEIVIPNGVKFIGESIFSACESLKKIELPADLTVIPYRTFYSCKSLVHIDIPSGVTEIGENAFTFCSALKEIVLPASLNNLGKLPFNSCDALSKIYYEGTQTAWNALKEQNNVTAEQAFSNAAIYYYSVAEPAEEGNYWHYDNGGNIAEW